VLNYLSTMSWRLMGVEVQLERSWPQHQMELSGQLYGPASLPPRIGGWVDPRATHCGEKKILPCWESNPGSPAHRYTDWATPTYWLYFKQFFKNQRPPGVLHSRVRETTDYIASEVSVCWEHILSLPDKYWSYSWRLWGGRTWVRCLQTVQGSQGWWNMWSCYL
jgi:hypothetical protein